MEKLIETLCLSINRGNTFYIHCHLFNYKSISIENDTVFLNARRLLLKPITKY